MSTEQSSQPAEAVPGAVVQPGTPPPQDTNQPASSAPVAPDPPAPAQQPTPPAPDLAAAVPVPNSNAPAQQPNTRLPAPDAGAVDGVSWTASEFIAHDKNAAWYAGLAAVAVIGAVMLYMFTKDVVTPAVVVVAAIIFGVYASHKPRQVEYVLGAHGIQVGARHYDYELFRSFSIVPEQAFSSIMLMPLKRFAAPLSLYYAPDDEEEIATILSERLPYEPHRLDMTDRMLRRIRF